MVTLSRGSSALAMQNVPARMIREDFILDVLLTSGIHRPYRRRTFILAVPACDDLPKAEDIGMPLPQHHSSLQSSRSQDLVSWRANRTQSEALGSGTHSGGR